MKYEIAKKFLAVRRAVPSEPNFAVKPQSERQRLSVDRESTALFAMKYAIGEIFFLRVRFGMTLRPGMSMPRTTGRKLQRS
jgi:hypothetical protein